MTQGSKFLIKIIKHGEKILQYCSELYMDTFPILVKMAFTDPFFVVNIHQRFEIFRPFSTLLRKGLRMVKNSKRQFVSDCQDVDF